jgi:hypothetical protein
MWDYNVLNLNQKAMFKRYNCFSQSKIKNEIVIYTVITVLCLILASCKKLAEVDAPTNSLSRENVYRSDATATAVMTGIYTNMSAGDGFTAGANGISIGAGLSADELDIDPNYDVTLFAQYQNKLSNATFPGYWKTAYNYLYTVNAVLEGVAASNSLSSVVKQQLLGEAKFMRAFYYFYLVNLYGDVPLLTTTDYKTNGLSVRASKEQVYQQIIKDLKEAKEQLSSNFLTASLKSTSTERVRPTKWAATALLARAYLNTNRFDSAELQANEVINNTTLFSLGSLNNVFLKNSSEAIWQLQPVNEGWNTEDAIVFILPAAGPNNFQNPVYLGSFLINAFENGDQRFQNWVGSTTVGSITYYYPFKYKSAQFGDPLTEYLMVLRLTEQYLIRAEARAKQNKILEAKTDLNLIRTRAGLSNTTANDQGSLLAAILHERQVEFFTEWGHRWLDLKRTQNINSIMNTVTPAKGGIWNSNWQFYPISLSELQIDPNLSQNPGY